MLFANYPRLARRGKLLGFLGVLLLAGLVQGSGLLHGVELKLLDREFVLLRDRFPRPVADDVVIVGIDEATLAALPEPVTLWHRHLGRFLDAMARAHPAVVGVDVILPDRSYDSVAPGYDRELLAGILALRKSSPLVLAATIDATGRPRAIYPPYLSVAGEGSAGLALLRAERDRLVRRFDERLGADGQRVPTLVGRMSERLGRPPVPAGLIDYSIGEPFAYVPLLNVLGADDATLVRLFSGKRVLLGSVLPYEDQLPVPVRLAQWDNGAGQAPGVLVHAQALRSIMGAGLVRPAAPQVPWGLIALASTLWFVPLRAGIATALWALLALLACAAATALLYRGTWLPVCGAMVAAGCAVFGRIGLGAVQQIRERQRLRRAFSGYVSPEIMSQIVSGKLALRLGGDRLRICVMFADIRDFTARSEAMAPEAVILLLNRYFEGITAAIHERGGTVDKFMGDGIMAFFGAPKPQDNPAPAAFHAAREMLARLAEINIELKRDGIAPIAIGIGMHVGDAVVGLVGSTTRHEYTAIGDAVNVASRLESLTKETGFALVCSRRMREYLDDEAGFTYLGPRQIKGHTPVEVYGWKDSESAGTP
jgi:class 3 adenylate cyclase/CHASE2 domain-containing sensor protein